VKIKVDLSNHLMVLLEQDKISTLKEEVEKSGSPYLIENIFIITSKNKPVINGESI